MADDRKNGSSGRGRPKKAEADKVRTCTFALYPRHVDMISNLAEELGVSRSEVVRWAVKCAHSGSKQEQGPIRSTVPPERRVSWAHADEIRKLPKLFGEDE